MKIETGNASLYANQPTQAPAPGRAASGAFAAALDSAIGNTADAQTEGGKPDFTSMTHQQMRDWTNEQIRGGKMSLDESGPFMAMSLHIPVVGGAAAGIDGERVDFTQKLRAGIEGAQSRNDEATRKMLESAMSLLERYQPS